jgi:parallel beta-helix repeat protein
MSGRGECMPGDNRRRPGTVGRLILLGALCVVMSALVVRAPESASGMVSTLEGQRVIHLNAEGSGDFATLAQALAAAPAGATIELAAGSYPCAARPFESDRDVALVGAGADSTEILCGAPEYVLRHKVDGVFSAEGLTFRHEGTQPADGLRIEGSATTALHLCSFRGAVAGGSQGIPGAGLHLGGESVAQVTESSATANQIGVLVAERAWADLTTITADRNATFGISFSGTASGIARSSDCAFNRQGGIAVADRAAPTLDANVCSNNLYFGIGYFDSSGGAAHDNRPVGNTYMGIIVTGQASPRLEANSCRYNGSFGIFYYDGQPAGLAYRNDCSGNGQGGIAVGSHARPRLENNECRNNLGTGIVYYEEGGGSAAGNQLTGNRRYGLAVTQGAKPTIGENAISGNAIEDIRTFHGERDATPSPVPVGPAAS